MFPNLRTTMNAAMLRGSCLRSARLCRYAEHMGKRPLSSKGRSPLAPTPRVFPPSTAKPKNGAPSTHTTPLTAAESLHARTKDRGPVSWTSLFLVSVAAASAVAYYRIERERRLERAMGKVVSSESDGWTPRPDFLAKRKFVPTQVCIIVENRW